MFFYVTLYTYSLFRFPEKCNMNLSKIEEEVLEFWDKEEIFKKSIERRKDAPVFSFYDGPPFATGNPHYGHILATTIKDAVLRYKTMRGFRVPRRVGWDCHGLPVENLIEKELKIKSKKEIEEMGIMEFNQECRGTVFRCVDEFARVLKRVGRWADYDNSYSTLDNDYIESVWWVFKQLYDRDLVYRDYRVTPYCTRCGTPISNFEVNQGYAEKKDPSIFVKFKVRGGEFDGVFLLAWTTTPWTVPGNVALAVNQELSYVLISYLGEKFILSKERVKDAFDDEGEVLREMKGKELVGLQYEPLFSFIEDNGNAFRVYSADFVSDEDGTGVVHIAPMYGEEDFNLGKAHDLPFVHTVDEGGKFLFGEMKGRDIREGVPELEKHILKQEEITHSYPFCWRCDTPLVYYALQTFYIAVTKIKEQMLSNNEKIFWQPDHIKHGRFGKWLEGARDWAFSRNRFWGAPIPIWECEKCGKFRVVASREEVGEMDDLHRPFIDEVNFDCDCGGTMKRVEEVFDCWFESGAMPYAQWHYPFENKKMVEETFPADFIAEGVDQTRGWFYTLHVLATALTVEDVGLGKDLPPFRNVIVNGFVLDAEGKKLSKKLGNYPTMDEVFSNFGADSLRFFLLASTPIGEDYLFSSDRVKEYYGRVISTFYHSFSFFNSYGKRSDVKATEPLNLWILSRLKEVNQQVTEEMERYDLTVASRSLVSFVDDLSNWYIRRARKDFKEGKEEYFSTLYTVLVELSKMLAPFAPFISEHVYRKLTGELSVHLETFPEIEKEVDEELLFNMNSVRETVSEALKQRADAGIKIRQPLSSLTVKKDIPQELLGIIKDEVNVKEVHYGEKVELSLEMTEELKEEGEVREIIRCVQSLRKAANLTPQEEINLFCDKFTGVIERNKKEIMKETLAVSLEEKGKESVLVEKKVKLAEGEVVFAINVYA